MRTRSIAAIFVAVLLVGSLASCSKKDSGSSDESTGDSTEETAKSTTTEASSDEGDSSNPASADDIQDVLGDCGQVYVLYSSMVASSAGLMGGATEEQIKELEAQADEVRASVPEDLQDDIQTVSDAYKEFAQAIGDGGIMSGDAADAAEALDSDEVKAAQANLEEYFNSCQ